MATQSAPTTSNSAAGLVNTGIAVTMKAAEVGVEKLIVADFPWAGLPVINQMINGLISYIGGKFSEVLQGIGTFTVIDAQVDGEQATLSQALANLIAAEKSGDQAQIQTAIQAYAAAQSALIHDDGSATPQP